LASTESCAGIYILHSIDALGRVSYVLAEGWFSAHPVCAGPNEIRTEE
jgi:hypothetical protein